MRRNWIRIGAAAVLAVIILGITFRGASLVTSEPSPPLRAKRTEVSPYASWSLPGPGLPRGPTAVADGGNRSSPQMRDREERLPQGLGQRMSPSEISGTLAVEVNEERVGQESYILSRSEDETIRLSSQGKLSFKIPFLTVNLNFTQEVMLDSQLSPLSVLVDLHGPLGIGSRRMEARVDGDQMVISSRGKTAQQRINPEYTFILAMFSSYALIPLVFQDRAEDDRASFTVLAWGGPPAGGKDGDGSDPSESFPAEVALQGTATVVVDSEKLEVDRYRVITPTGESTLLAKGQEFIAFQGQGEQGRFSIYRSDYFPEGLNIPRRFEPASSGER